jgi:hypothetical protein
MRTKTFSKERANNENKLFTRFEESPINMHTCFGDKFIAKSNNQHETEKTGI